MTAATIPGVESRPAASELETATAGKACAMLLYSLGARTLEQTQAEFDRHPEWSAA